MRSEVKGLSGLGVGADSVEVAFNCRGFIKTSPVFEVNTGWSVSVHSEFEVVWFVRLATKSISVQV